MLTIHSTVGTEEPAPTPAVSDEDRAKGYVRPVRDRYIHAGVGEVKGCGTETRMARYIAEDLARDPGFHTGTYCLGCRKHLPLGEFRWLDGQVVGS